MKKRGNREIFCFRPTDYGHEIESSVIAVAISASVCGFIKGLSFLGTLSSRFHVYPIHLNITQSFILSVFTGASSP